MSDRHVDAHWDCKRCGTQLIRAWGGGVPTGSPGGYWVYTDGGNGERRCRDDAFPKAPPRRDAPLHEPDIVDLADPTAVEEWLVR